MVAAVKNLPWLKSWFSTEPQALPPYVEDYINGPRPDEQISWRAVPYTVLDIETTGLDARRDAVLSIGLVEIEEGRIRLDKRWYTLVRPPDDMVVPAESIRIHGLLREDVAGAPSFAEILPDLLCRLAGHVLVVHYSAIDVRFLSRTLEETWGVKLRGPAIDTMLLGQALHHYANISGQESANGAGAPTALRVLAESAGVPIHAQHNALSDALTTAQLFLAQVTRLERYGFGTLRQLLKAGRCLR